MRPFLAPVLIAALGLGVPAALAQGTEVPFGSIRHDSSLPVEVTANRLEVDQEDGSAVFTGDVIVGQGEMRLSADEVRILYSDNDAQTREIDRMLATGNVVLVNGPEAAESDAAVYTLASGNIVMTGNVLLTQGANALSGDRFTVDLDTGNGVMEGRVRTLLQPSGPE
jgi:lipopolysaccharide export system protein LptA